MEEWDAGWEFDWEFLGSRWRCRWGDGCLGILDEPAEELAQGCCSIGAELLDRDEAMQISALAATLDPARFEQHQAAAHGGVFRDDARDHTRVVDGACIFFNRPGFAGGVGCALHLAAVDADEAPMDWKPSVCWQLPLKVDRSGERPLLRRWTRADWGEGGATMHWCCTEGSHAYDGDERVIDALAGEIEALVGHDTYVEIRRHLDTPT